MIAVDTSIFVAITGREPEAAALGDALARGRVRWISAANYLECAMISESRYGGRSRLDEWLRTREVGVYSVDRLLAELAADAFARFGKGRHAAGLNYGDCFAYALARHLRAPLLFKGGDFAQTDVEPALV